MPLGPVTTLDHADLMLGHLRSQYAGHGHELARAMLVSATLYLRDTFGQQHALAVVGSLVPPVLGVGEPPQVDPVPGEAGASEVPRPVLH